MPTRLNDLQAPSLTAEQERQIIALLDYGLEIFYKSAAEVSLVLADDEYLRQLNREYRGIDQPTDVLSFAMAEGLPAPETVDLLELLGDIYISKTRAVAQADSYGHSFQRELCYLAVHGLLHLLGFDHQTPEATAVMREREERIMREFGLERF
jgi:probable rRNA maturation factor